MILTYDQMLDLTNRCLDVVKGFDPSREEMAREDIDVGELDLAIADALGIAYRHPELYAQFPEEVYELAKDPDYTAIHPYLDLLERHRDGNPA